MSNGGTMSSTGVAPGPDFSFNRLAEKYKEKVESVDPEFSKAYKFLYKEFKLIRKLYIKERNENIDLRMRLETANKRIEALSGSLAWETEEGDEAVSNGEGSISQEENS